MRKTCFKQFSSLQFSLLGDSMNSPMKDLKMQATFFILFNASLVNKKTINFIKKYDHEPKRGVRDNGNDFRVHEIASDPVCLRLDSNMDSKS